MEIKIEIDNKFGGENYLRAFESFSKNKGKRDGLILVDGKVVELMDEVVPQLKEQLEFDRIMEEVLDGDST